MQRTQSSRGFANPLPESPPELTGAKYSGYYFRANDHLIVREGDGLRLLAKRGPSWWTLVEPDGGPYVSRVFTDNGHTEFEHNRVRYRLMPPEVAGSNRVQIVALRTVRPRLGAPKRRGRQ